MDPIAHTLVGATLGEIGLRERTRLALPALVVGANLPDIDVLALAAGSSAALDLRRSLTHGILGVALLPLALVGILVLWSRRRPRARATDTKQLLFLAYLATLTHPLLDWLNTSGVRLLSPFSSRWFYGDALFIIDPWVWLVLGAVVLWGTTARGGRRRAVWILLATFVAATILIPPLPTTTLSTRVVWTLLLLALVVTRMKRWPPSETRVRPIALAALALIVGYVAAMVAISAWVSRAVTKDLTAQGILHGDVMAGPLPLEMLSRRIVAPCNDGYRVGRWTLGNAQIAWEQEPVSYPPPDAAIARAKLSPDARGWASWTRFPLAEVDQTDDSTVVRFGDLRYLERRVRPSYGSVHVELTPEGEP